MRQDLELVPVEVELVLTPGLPRIHFIGLPDAALKESALRIRTAIRKQGFRLPKGQQILVHLRPSHLRKSSRGLDLAIAAAILWETEQVPRPENLNNVFLYGEITLTGEVETPEDFFEIPYIESAIVYTGPKSEACALPSIRLRELRNFAGPIQVREPSFETQFPVRPKPLAESFPPEAARLAEVIAAGEHSALIAGPSGTGKSTLAASIPAWLEEPQKDREEWTAAIRWARVASAPIWRPFVRPHHTITKLAMIGGGQSAWSGEISRAHTGVLLLDELLEFDPEIQEALREPVENGVIAITRAGRSRVHPAQVVLLATTNLCDCGGFVPKASAGSHCRCAPGDRRRKLRRLTGPFADRFAILAYSDEWLQSEEPEDGMPGRRRALKQAARIPANEILERVSRAIEFRRRSRSQKIPNARLTAAEIEPSLTALARESLMSALEGCSYRRKESVLRIARTLADLRESSAIDLGDFDKALKLGWAGHKLLQDWRD